MKFILLLKHLILSAWRNASPIQAALITAIILAIVIIVIISVVQAIVPFTYIAI